MSASETHVDSFAWNEKGELLKVGQVADLLQCSQRSVYRLADAGKMPRPIKIGSLVRWPKAVLAEWIDGGCKPVRMTTHRQNR